MVKGNNINRDHLPPKSFFACKNRHKSNINLIILKVHEECNKKYKEDEQYFLYTFLPTVRYTKSGRDIFETNFDYLTKNPHGIRLGIHILNEFEEKPWGIYLPYGQVGKKYDVKRVRRVIWKITKGLFYIRKGDYLPDDVLRNPEIYNIANQQPPELNKLFLGLSSLGKYPDIFDYFYRELEVPNKGNLHCWKYLFWGRIGCLFIHHDPVCSFMDT